MKEQILSDKQRRAKRIYGTVGIALTVILPQRKREMEHPQEHSLRCAYAFRVGGR